MKTARLVACLLLLCLGVAAARAAEPPKPAAAAGTPCPEGMSAPGGVETTPAAETPGPAKAKRLQREPGELVMYWPDEETAARDLTRLEKSGLRPLERARLGALGGVVVLLRQQDAGADMDALRRRLRLSMRSAAVDFNTRYYFESGPRQYFARHIQLTGASAPGPLASVGIIDGPVAAIPALRDSPIVRRSFIPAGAMPSPPHHATTVASLIAGVDPKNAFTGSAVGARLYSAEIMQRTGNQDSTTTLALVQAIDWLLAHQVRVINLSLGGAGDALMARTFERLARMPVVVVAAAGNGGPDAPPSFPAAYPGVLAVTASNAAYEAYALASRGSHIALTAPGEAVWAPDHDQGQYVSGSSFAAAQVSGAVSRLMGLAPAANTAAVRDQLCRFALDLGTPGPDRVFGCGLLQVAPMFVAGGWAGQS